MRWRELVNANPHLAAHDELPAGAHITIPDPTTPTPSPTATATDPDTTEAGEDYTVVRGDNFWAIAEDKLRRLDIRCVTWLFVF